MLSLEEEIGRIAGRLFSFAFYLVGNWEDAEDITQNAFVKFLRYRKAYDPQKGDLYAYLQKLVVNEAHSFMMKDARFPKTKLSLNLIDSKPTPSQVMEAKETESMVRQGLTCLTPREREIFVLKEMEQRSYQEIADYLGLKAATIRRFYSMARVKLKAYMLDIQKGLRK